MANSYGLVAAVSRRFANLTKFEVCPLVTLNSWMPRSPWEMRKGELLEELASQGVTGKEKWTVPELRSLCIEMRGPTVKAMGLTKLTLEQLKEKCRQEGVAFPEKATRGVLMRLLRESKELDGDSPVTFREVSVLQVRGGPGGVPGLGTGRVEEGREHLPGSGALGKVGGGPDCQRTSRITKASGQEQSGGIQTAFTAECTGVVSTTGASYGGSGTS